ncbi:AbrB family transcriptional regulator [Desmospora activa]|uniref:Membrane AbrB-like protein n=1 Tax=Desmospora activa DSM 45169 TaxID=1121389 RepID=A0A2T4Z0S1_9BACL|nr:AbrB family transcriptional regulator [Desmospora activa]PTM53315.1 hypothetical protein C8J48_3639 [Desmospora activa DSM 45169]
MEWSRTALTLLCALLGGWLGHSLRIPAGPMIGSMVGVASVQLIGFPLGAFPSWLPIGLQICLGAMLGLKITRQTLVDLQSVWAPAIIVALLAVAFGVIVGWLISRVAGWDYLTSYFSAAPGGMSDLLLIASTTEADTSKVMTLHLVRLVTVILTVPLLVKWFFK